MASDVGIYKKLKDKEGGNHPSVETNYSTLRELHLYMHGIMDPLYTTL